MGVQFTVPVQDFLLLLMLHKRTNSFYWQTRKPPINSKTESRPNLDA